MLTKANKDRTLHWLIHSWFGWKSISFSFSSIIYHVFAFDGSIHKVESICGCITIFKLCQRHSLSFISISTLHIFAMWIESQQLFNLIKNIVFQLVFIHIQIWRWKTLKCVKRIFANALFKQTNEQTICLKFKYICISFHRMPKMHGKNCSSFKLKIKQSTFLSIFLFFHFLFFSVLRIFCTPIAVVFMVEIIILSQCCEQTYL